MDEMWTDETRAFEICEAERQAVIDQTADETGRDREELAAYEFEIQEPDRG